MFTGTAIKSYRLPAKVMTSIYVQLSIWPSCGVWRTFLTVH